MLAGTRQQFLMIAILLSFQLLSTLGAMGFTDLDVRPVAEIKTGEVEDVEFSPDGRYLAIGSSLGMRLYSIASLPPESIPLRAREDSVSSIGFSPDSRMLAVAFDSLIEVWDTGKRELVSSIVEHVGWVESVSFSCDQTLLAYTSDNSSYLWDVENRKGIDFPLNGHEEPVKTISFSPNGNLLASGSMDHKIKLWDIVNSQCIRTLRGHTDTVMSIDFSPDGSLLVSGSADNTIRLWNSETGECIEPPVKGHKDWVSSVTVSSGGEILGSGSWDNTVRLWSLEDKICISPPLLGHLDLVSSVAFSPDGKFLASGSTDGTVLVWTIEQAETSFIDKYLERKSSPMIGEGIHYIKWGEYFGIDPSLAVAISGAESKFGINPAGNKYNVWGWRGDYTNRFWDKFEPGWDPDTNKDEFKDAPGFIPGRGIYMSTGYEDGIFWVNQNLRSSYFDLGLTNVEEIGRKWCTEGTENWIRNVTLLLEEIQYVSRLRDIINTKLFQRPVYPPYLLDTDSFSSAVNTIWQNFTDWFRRDDLTDNYDELYFTGIEYDSLKYGALIKARDFLETGDIANAEKYLKKAETYETLSYMSFQGASYVFEANLEVAKIIAQSIKDGCQTAVTFGLKFVSPTAASAADFIYDVIDLGIEYHLGDQEKAVRDFLVKRSIKVIFSKVPFEDLGGKTVADWTQNRTGKYLFPVLSKLTKSQEWQWALSDVIKESVEEITKEELIDIVNSITDEAIRRINVLETEVKSPVELRVYDSQDRATGLVNGEVKCRISCSFYDNGTVTIFFPMDVYRYELLGIDTGKYGFEIALSKDGETNTFTATDIPTSPNELHRYSVDWDILPTGGEGIYLEIDANGDGAFEQTITADSDLTKDEYTSVACITVADKQPTKWGDIKQTRLLQNFPNPSNPETWIPFELSMATNVQIRIYDIGGGIVRTLDLGYMEAGVYRSSRKAAYWDGKNEYGEDASSGLYFYRICAGDFTDVRKLIILR